MKRLPANAVKYVSTGLSARKKRKLAGTDSIVYTCQSQINGELHLYELKYIIGSYYWELYKI
jgi:hypothetical protein